MADNYSDENIKAIAAKVAKELFEESSGMEQYMLAKILEALEKGEDVDDSLVNVILANPFMSKLIDELLKLDEE